MKTKYISKINDNSRRVYKQWRKIATNQEKYSFVQKEQSKPKTIDEQIDEIIKNHCCPVDDT